MDEKKNKHDNMIIELELLEQEKKKLEFRIKRLKENIDEFETNHLFLYLNTNIIKNDNKHT